MKRQFEWFVWSVLRNEGCFNQQDMACERWEATEMKEGSTEEVACLAWRRVCAGCRAGFQECETLQGYSPDPDRINWLYYILGAVAAIPILVILCAVAVRG